MKPKSTLSIWKIIFWGIIFAAIAYPFAFSTQKAIPSLYIFSSYHNFLIKGGGFLNSHKTFILVILISLFFTGSKRYYSVTASKMRLRHLDQEIDRWKFTPYIAPLHLYYMFFPPQTYSLSSWKGAQAIDTSYRYTVDRFRNLIFKRSYTSLEAQKRPTLFQIIGFKTTLEIFGYLISLLSSLFIMIYFKQDLSYYSGLGLAMIPIQTFLTRRIYWLLKAIFHSGATYIYVDKFFLNNYGTREPYIKLNDTLPDQKIGLKILEVWEEECLRRQKIYNKFRKMENNQAIILDCPALPESPFSEREISSWIDDISEDGITVRNQSNKEQLNRSPQKNSFNSKVIQLSHYKRRKI
ncbi:hypothetical protein IAQ67_14515 [Paenibacillus peoriae]|uniref:Uncharacterized protein n=1 Tax=Paenibacillus peoriae TaxID=59893 RepID=A0A7H0Y221_9BACL|nr:hypothetical protein [Paenibacillus peoriae]QNR65129.1 hypothetical protein IAQ67_14515 [Paenibacillus peoriae]